MPPTSVFRQFLEAIQQIFEEIWFNILSLIETPQARLRRLRWLYKTDPKLDMTYRRAKEVVRGHLDSQYYDYYHRFLAAERLAHQQLKKLHHGARGEELFERMQELSEKIVSLIEEIQQLDKSIAICPPESDDARQISEIRDTLRARVEAALNAQTQIPLKMLNLTTTADTRSFDRLNESIDRLTNRLDDIATSYDDIRRYTDFDEAEADSKKEN